MFRSVETVNQNSLQRKKKQRTQSSEWREAERMNRRRTCRGKEHSKAKKKPTIRSIQTNCAEASPSYQNSKTIPSTIFASRVRIIIKKKQGPENLASTKRLAAHPSSWHFPHSITPTATEASQNRHHHHQPKINHRSEAITWMRLN